MKMKKNVTVIAIAIAIGSGALYLYVNRTSARAPIPTLSPRDADANTSAEYLNAQKAVQYYRDEIQQKPDEVKNYVELAQIFLQEARVTATHHDYFPKAASLLESALKLDPEDFGALVTKASMLLTLHQFNEAREIAEKALGKNSYNAACYGTLVDALVETGNYEEAVRVCDKMMSIRPDLRGYARVSYLRELHGDIQGAREAMKMAAEAGIHGQEQRAWALYMLGNLYLLEGKLDTAEFIYSGILQERPGYAFALSGLAQVKSAQGKYEEAISLLQRAFKILPEHLFLEQMVDLYQSVGRTDDVVETTTLVLREFEDHRQEGWNVAREYAMFASNHGINLAETLNKAEHEYESRPDNIDALQTYAWALHKNGNSSEAVPLIERALRLGTRNPTLFYQTGMIYRSAGKSVEGDEYLRKALKLNPVFHPLFAADARKALGLNNTLAFQN